VVFEQFLNHINMAHAPVVRGDLGGLGTSGRVAPGGGGEQIAIRTQEAADQLSAAMQRTPAEKPPVPAAPAPAPVTVTVTEAAAPAAAAPAAAATADPASKKNGKYLIGTQIEPGTWQCSEAETLGDIDTASWKVSDQANEIISIELDTIAIVPSDGYTVDLSGCATMWTKV